MEDGQKKNSFDELVAGISAEERKFLLDKLNGSAARDIPILQPVRDETGGASGIDARYQNESVLYRFILWIRSLFAKRPPLELYNDDVIHGIARRVQHSHPGLIDEKSRLFLSVFYGRLKELKDSAEFFRPYFSIVSENPGRFYVFLSTFIAPEISERLNAEADPYSISFDRAPTMELRTSLIRKLEAVLKEIQPATRKRLYSAVHSADWLRRFSELPFIHFGAQFTAVGSESYTCPFSNAQVDFPIFARVLNSADSIQTEVLEALFLYPQKHGTGSVGMDADSEAAMREFLERAAACISMIQMFISTVPLTALGRVAFHDSNWQIEQSGGGEDWFVKFKEEWKQIFDERWNAWLRDSKKVKLASVLREQFGIEQFPELPERPWADLWGGIPFRCEMTGGFLCWFAQNRYGEVMGVLNVLVLEGIFLNSGNRTELAEAVNEFSEVNQLALDFADSLSERGAVGLVFVKLQGEHIRTLRGQAAVDSLLLNAEGSLRDYAKRFCAATRTIERVLHGILDDEKDRDYESIQNLMTIKGRDNHAFRIKMAEVRQMLNNARHIFTEIEPLDLPKK